MFKNELLATSDALYAWIFEGLWCLSDREGRLEDRPRRIHLEINAGRAYEGTEASLNWLSENGFILRYEHGGNRYIQVLQFKKHQNPHVREPASVIPAPGEHSASTVPAPEEHESGPALSSFPLPESPSLKEEGARKRASSRSTNGKKPKTALPEGFALDGELRAYAEERLPQVDVAALFESFCGKARAKSWVYADWRQAWQEFCRNTAPGSGHWAQGQYPKLKPQGAGTEMVFAGKPVKWQ
jgi:hypothetical protein